MAPWSVPSKVRRPRTYEVLISLFAAEKSALHCKIQRP